MQVSPLIQATAPQLCRLVECTSRSVVATILIWGCFLTTLPIIPMKALGSSLDLGGSFRSRDAESQLEVFLVPDEHIDILHNAIEDRYGALVAARDVPELGPVIEVEGNHCASRFGGLSYPR